jgi:hypothetical protein
MIQRDEILNAFGNYELKVSTGRLSDQQADDEFAKVEQLVPHARLSDLCFWGERERTKEEIVDEALFREDLWRNQGDLAVLVHIHAQMQMTLEDPNARELDIVNASQGITDILAEIEKLNVGTA